MASDLRLFWREFRQTYRTTGAIAPSGRALSKALARFVPPPNDSTTPRRILEVGPGTGAVTCALIRALGPNDTLDLVELNDRFVGRLRERMAHDPTFQPAAPRMQLFHQSVEELPLEPPYDVIVSGLPLNNFAVDDVRRLLDVMRQRLRVGGVMSFFEYVWIRGMKALVSGREERRRLRGIASTMQALLDEQEIHRDLVWSNVPPAWVHHVRRKA
jgi:phospholipid N-methyltransferase